MLRLRAFAEEIRSRVEGIDRNQLAANEQSLSLHTIVLLRVQLDELSQRLLTILGEDRIREFYQGYAPTNVTARSHLMGPLAREIPACCQASSDGHISLDADRLLARLKSIADCIEAGEVVYSLSLRITNIATDSDFELADGILFRRIPPELVQQKYPIERQFTAISPMVAEHWLSHCVEAVIPGRGTMADLQQRIRIEQTEATVNSILHAFLLAEVPAKTFPAVTHVVLDSPLEGSCLYRGIGSMCCEPRMLGREDIAAVRRAYAFLRDVANDRILQTAVDRFILGKKRGEHHPNRINEPNWDKIVDYVIAMETLFLTTEGQPLAQELAYRFRLNGSSVISRAAGGTARRIFHALKHLYELRSKVVHGCEDATILKPANKFIRELEIDSPNHQHSLGRLMLVSRKVEDWIGRLLFFLGDMPVADRPYKRGEGWEEMLWREEEQTENREPSSPDQPLR